MQVTATTTAAKPLPVDLMPESSSSFSFSHSRRKAAVAASKAEWSLQNSKAATAALNNPRWFGRVALLVFHSCYFVKEVRYG
ncbi:MAG: hypothetical protein PHQ05_09140 [Sterolibacterium sp.]|nr:hypothetical protein [Sterolibacterium sp.]